MIAVAVASEALMAKLDANKADLAKLADPRTIKMDDARGRRDRAARRAGLLHHRHDPLDRGRRADGADGAGVPAGGRRQPVHPQHPRARHHADHADRRSRTAATASWTSTSGSKKHPNDTPPSALYWGHYVAHDNNRDAMGLTLKLSQNVLNTYLGLEGAGAARPARVGVVPLRQHDRQRPVQRVARSDPDQRVADDRLEQRQRDDAHGHARRLRVRHVRHVVARLPDVHGRDAQRHQPPVRDVRQRRQRRHARSGRCRPTRRRAPGTGRTRRSRRVRWSLRNNNNYEQTGLLVSLNYFANNRVYFLRNFYDKSKRSITKAEGRRAGGLRASRRAIRGSGAQAELLRVLQKQARGDLARDGGVHRDDAGAAGRGRRRAAAGGGGRRRGGAPAAQRAGAAGGAAGARGRRTPPAPPPQPTTREFPAGSYIVRMDQPYSRIADALLDYQYWAPNDAQTRPYDDTGWTFPEGFGVQAVRVTDAEGARRADGAGQGRGEGAERRHRHGHGLRDQPQRRQRAHHAALQAEGRRHPDGRGAVRRRRHEVQPRHVHRQGRGAGRSRQGRRRRSGCKARRARRGADR